MPIDADTLAKLIATNLRDAINDGRAQPPHTFWFEPATGAGSGSAVVQLGQTKITIETTDVEVIRALEAPGSYPMTLEAANSSEEEL